MAFLMCCLLPKTTGADEVWQVGFLWDRLVSQSPKWTCHPAAGAWNSFISCRLDGASLPWTVDQTQSEANKSKELHLRSPHARPPSPAWRVSCREDPVESFCCLSVWLTGCQLCRHVFNCAGAANPRTQMKTPLIKAIDLSAVFGPGGALRIRTSLNDPRFTFCGG